MVKRFFFFKQKTAYEIYQCDWSSDVCSSDLTYTIGEEKVIINVGSVGQPRDRDPRATYVIVSNNEVEFVRVEYNIDVTAKRIRDNPHLDDFLGDRLYKGK